MDEDQIIILREHYLKRIILAEQYIKVRREEILSCMGELEQLKKELMQKQSEGIFDKDGWCCGICKKDCKTEDESDECCKDEKQRL